jgi:hypothetical protein
VTSPAPLRSRLSIGEVLDRLRVEFPEISISKIRYLEAEGLTCQREKYLPLKVIKEHLDAIDRGLEPPELPGGGPQVPRMVLAADNSPDPDAFRPDTSGLRLSRRELAEAAGIDDTLLDQLEDFGLVKARWGSTHYDGDALVIAKTVAELAAFGLEPRHLRSFKTAADREVGLVEQVVSPMRGGRDGGSRARADEAAREITAVALRLHAALVRAGLMRAGLA